MNYIHQGFKRTYQYDQLQYHYQNTTNNKLDYVDDQVPARITGDLDLGPGQVAGNYVYDASGNLVKDVQGGLEEITWNAMGKVDVIRNPDAGQYISFYYDGMGQRVRKDVLTEDGNGDGDLLSDLYTRDAQGNILAVYKRKAKVNNNNFIGWLNQSIIDQHPLWTPGSGTGLPAVVATIAGPASVFREHLLNHNTVRTAWAPGYISSAYTPSQYAQHSPLIYNEVTNGLSFGDFYPVMRSYNGGAALKTEAQQNTTFAKRLLLPLFTVGEAAVSGSGTDTSLAVVLMTMKESAPDMLDYLAFQRGVTSDVTSGIDVATGMYDYLSNNPWSAYEIVDKDLGGYYGSADMTSFISAVVDQDSIYTVSFYEDAMKSGYREELYTTILSNDSLKSPALDVCVQLKDAKEPGWFDDVSEDEKVSAAYDLHTENFIGDLVSSGYLSALNEALSAYYTVYTPDGSARVQWVTYMQELTLLQQVTSGPLSSTYTFPTVTLTTPDYLKIDSVQLAEHHLYGSSRLGIKSYPDGYLVNVFNVEVPAQNVSYLSARSPWYHLGQDNLVQASAKLPYVGATSNMYTRTAYLVKRYLGLKHYELTDHLGNVNVTILDKKTGTGDGNPGEYAYLSANLSSFTDYYPFGMPMPERNGSVSHYRMGFNGQEKDDEIRGKGNSLEYKYRGFDTRIARFFAVDPLAQSYPYFTPYQFAGNSPIHFIDLEGLEPGEPGYRAFMGGLSISNPTAAKLETKIVNSPEYYKGMAYGMAAGTVFTLDVFAFKGKASQLFFVYTPMAALFEHNRATTPEGQAAQDKRFRDGVADLAIGYGMSRTISAVAQTAAQTSRVIAKSISVKIRTPQIGEGFVSYGANISNGKVNISSRAVTSGTFDFVVTNEGKLMIGTGHYHLSKGAESVQAAGQLSIYKGKVTNINNSSGHYQPSVDEAKQFGNILKETGVDVSGSSLNIYNPSGVKVEKIKL